MPLLSFFALQAQERNALAGIKITPSLATIYPEYGIEASRFAISGGLQYIHPLGERVGIETGIYLLDRGSRIQFSQVDVSGFLLFTDTLFTRYLFVSVPIALRIEMGKAYIFAGPSMDYLVYGYEYFEDSGDKRVMGRDADDQNIRRLNVGGIMGLGYQQPVNEHINVFMEANVGSTLTYVDRVTPFRLVNFGLSLGGNISL